MLRIWLDHAKWIDLARAAHGRPGGAPYVDALETARFAVDRGNVSFVLDATRYIELHSRVEAGSRWRLAAVMYELSRLNTLASHRVLVKQEIVTAFHEVLGIPDARPPVTRIFGVGAGFAFGQPPYRYRVPEPLRSVLLEQEPGRVANYETWGTEQIERGLLFGPGADVAVESQRLIAEQQFGERYASGERELADRLEEEQVSRGRLVDAMSASEMLDILRPLNEVAADLGIDLGKLLSHKDFDGRSFLEHIPSHVVAGCLRTARHRNRQIKWKANDLHDVGGLAFAIPYCDVVCTEKSWVHHAVAARLDRRFSTRLISDVSELTSVIASAS